MIKVIFYCHENMNEYQEEFEFEDDIDEDGIQEEYEQWIWDKIGERFSWKKI